MKVFWSWQSDWVEDANRHFIKRALDEAVKQVGKELRLDEAERPALDHDTKDTPGAVDIADEIFRKIAASAVFVADVTPIGETSKQKALPNPNVMIELGWAVNKPGWGRIILVLNLEAGYEPDDLPFDLRKRRVLTYELKENATEVEKRQAKKRLTSDLAAALKINLKGHIDEKDAATDIVGVPHKVGDVSLWDSAVNPIEHSDAFGGARKTHVHLVHGPRSYVRIIPGVWDNGPPRVSEIAGLPDHLRLEAIADKSSAGDFGVCDNGFVHYWHKRPPGDDETPETKNVAIYLEETGEIWFLHGTAFEDTGEALFCRVEAIIMGWYFAVRRATHLLDHLDANRVRKIEVGVHDARDSLWPGQTNAESPRARKHFIRYAVQERDWNADKALTFVTGASEELWDLFGLGKPAANQIRAMTGQ